MSLMKPISVALFVLLALGCASTARVQIELERQMAIGDYASALEIVDLERSRSFRGTNRLLYFLERGMLLHVAGDYAESNAAFEEAKRIGDALYTKSLSAEGAALMTNDYALDYAGENFERTLIHLFAAMNYEQLGDRSSALVEVRQVGDYLRKLQVDSPNENVYQEDAFARYLSALLYESTGEIGAAFVDYKKALDAYADYDREFGVPRPDSLLLNAGRVATRLGSWATEDLSDRGWQGRVREVPEGMGELVILHYNGLGPIKGQDRFTIPFSEAWPMALAYQAVADDYARRDFNQASAIVSQLRGIDLVSVVFPKIVRRGYSIARMEPRVEGATLITGPELVEDIGAIAEKDLADRIVRIRTKAVARAAIKFALQKAAEAAARQTKNEDYGDLLAASASIVGNIARFASEQADKRVWSTLPDEIWMSSMLVPAGTHDLEVDFLTADSMPVESRHLHEVEVRPGGRHFVILRTVN